MEFKEGVDLILLNKHNFKKLVREFPGIASIFRRNIFFVNSVGIEMKNDSKFSCSSKIF